MVAIAEQPEATLGWADALLARDCRDLYVWTALEGVGVPYAWNIAQQPGIVAATLVGSGVDLRQVNLALDVAVGLARRRAGDVAQPRQSGGCLTAWSVPTPPPGAVRVPHLVTVRHAERLADVVVWELMSRTALRRWFGTAQPDLQFIESHLDTLLRMRAQVRARRLPATSARARLLGLLDQHNDLSIELVYQNPELFRVLLQARVRQTSM